MKKKLGRIAIVFLSFCIVSLLAGCGGGSTESNSSSVEDSKASASPQPANTFVLMGEGARANTPAINALPAFLAEAVGETIASSGYFDMAVLDGNVQVVGASMLASQKNTDEARSVEDSDTAAKCEHLLLGSKATEPEADLYGGLEAGAASLRSMPNAEEASATLFVVDSCIGTTGLLNFTSNMSVSSNPDDIGAYVASNGSLDLSGIDVVFVYLGKTAGDQPSPSAADIPNIKEALEIICTDAGASSVSFKEDPIAQGPQGAVEYHLPKCTIAKVSDPADFRESAAKEDKEFVLDADCGVSFATGTAEYRYPEAAEETIGYVAEAVVSSGRPIRVLGQCASDGDTSYRMDISRARANKVAASLIAAGVPQSLIEEVIGVGTNSEYHVDDLDANGVLVPELSDLNRVVRIQYV